MTQRKRAAIKTTGKPKAPPKQARATGTARPPHDLFNDPGEPKMLLTIDEAAARMNVSYRTVQRLVMRRECPSVKIGALRRIPVPQLEAYLAGLVEGAAFVLTA